MRVDFWPLLVALLLCLSSCKCDPDPPLPNDISFCGDEIAALDTIAARHVVLLLDRSSSATLSDADAQRYRNLFNDRVAPSLRGRNSTLRVHFIHAGSKGGLPILEHQQDSPLPKEGAFDADTQENCEVFMDDVERVKTRASEALDSLLTTAPDASTAGGTDIAGALDVAAGSLAGKDGERHVYVLTDMLTYVPGGRNFGRVSPKDDAEAQAWAQEDATALGLAGTPLQGVAVHFEPASFSNNVSTIATYPYWTAFVKALGGTVTINGSPY